MEKFNVDFDDVIKRLKTLNDNGLKELQNNVYQKKYVNKTFELSKTSLKDIKMGVIMDEFTFNCFKPECNIIELTPKNWKNEIDNFCPDLIFIESAWHGKDSLWKLKISNCSTELVSMVEYTKLQNIPVVFWSKEDPVHNNVFMSVALISDYIFTTDIDCIYNYKKVTGNQNVNLLHFAAQPTIHNPIEKYERKDKFCFAGSYYQKYPLRAEIFDKFSQVFIKTKGFDIFDRNFNNPIKGYDFPEIYNDNIIGCLKPTEIDKAYKGYTIGVNMNSVTQSQTMFARRVFEMLASNTITVGNYSRGVKNLFGDLTICTDDQITLEKELLERCGNEVELHKYRLLGLRKVLKNNLYEDRLDFIIKKVFGKSLKPKLPLINVISIVSDINEAKYIIKKFNNQTYDNKKLTLVSNENISIENATILNKNDVKSITNSIKNSYIALFDTSDYYGENYLLDLILTLRYGDYNGVGKAVFYENINDNLVLQKKGNLYESVEKLTPSRSIINSNIIEDVNGFLNNIPLNSKDLFCVDEFNYAKNIVCNNCSVVDDIDIFDKGIEFKYIDTMSCNIKTSDYNTNSLTLDANSVGLFETEKDIKCINNNNKIQIISKLSNNRHKYFYNKEIHMINNYVTNNNLSVKVIGSGDLDLILTIIFYDKNKEKISPAYPKLNRISNVTIPSSAFYFKIGFRAKNSGKFDIESIIIGGNNDVLPSTFLTRSKTLILSNQYPSQEHLYRKMFIHKRIVSYKENDFVTDMIQMNNTLNYNFREFEGVNVTECLSDNLDLIIKNGDIDTICVHFLDKYMWSVLKNYSKQVRILVWVHGSEIQPWWRREYNYTTNEELELAKRHSNNRMILWNEVFSLIEEYNIHFIFVSEYFANEVFEDYNIDLPKNKYSIIHNCIDTELFKYIPKKSKQRLKIISVRPYASRQYANDLTVKVIELLSKKEYFNELEFFIAGDGELFDVITPSLLQHKNVTLERRFFSQNELSKLYQDYGIVLIPSRMDTHGVSRDEAMSCGCVPITNAVAAIPEFVDEKCGFLAEPENAQQMADAIDFLYHNPDKFLEISKNASDRVFEQSSKKYTIDKEIDLINNER